MWYKDSNSEIKHRGYGNPKLPKVIQIQWKFHVQKRRKCPEKDFLIFLTLGSIKQSNTLKFWLKVVQQLRVLSQDFEVRRQTRILRCEVVEGGRKRGTRHLLNEAKI